MRLTRHVIREAYTENRRRSRIAANEVTRLEALVASREAKVKQAKTKLAAARKRAE